jgi:hypothetical protein
MLGSAKTPARRFPRQARIPIVFAQRKTSA